MVTGIVQHRSLRRMSWSTDGRAVVRRWRSPQAGSGSWPAAVQDRRAGAAVPPGPSVSACAGAGRDACGTCWQGGQLCW